MIVLTLLVSERQLARVTRATPTPHRIVQTTSALEARSLLRQQPADVLVDAMRGRSSTWTRIRVNLQHVPDKLRPVQEPLDPDEKTLSSS